MSGTMVKYLHMSKSQIASQSLRDGERGLDEVTYLQAGSLVCFLKQRELERVPSQECAGGRSKRVWAIYK